MKADDVINAVKDGFAKEGNPAEVPLVKGGNFTAQIIEGGIIVSNLGNDGFLPWNVFSTVIELLEKNNGRAVRGDAMNCRLGDPGLPIDSVEGVIALKVYGKEEGDSVFRRITPVACLLIWANLCTHEPGQLVLL